MINKLCTGIKNHIAIICMVFGLVAATLVLGSWLYGYWSNGLYGTRFQIDSCWQGISACGMGLVGLFKWVTDSTKNSPPGQYPMPGGPQRPPPPPPMPYNEERRVAESPQKSST